jgi:hypothetical protein
MFYKPKFCSDCGEKVERSDWKPWTSRRFCELCETDHKMGEWLPRMVFAVGILGAVFGLGTWLQRPEKPLNIIRTVQAADLTGKTENAAPQAVRNTADPAESFKTSDLNITNKEVSAPQPQNPASDNVYYCGAATKQGMPCKRLVKGGGRCWQHIGKLPIKPENKTPAGK